MPNPSVRLVALSAIVAFWSGGIAGRDGRCDAAELMGDAGPVQSVQTPPNTQLASPRPWDASLRIFGESDDNVPLQPLAGSAFAGHKRSLGGGVYAAGAYRFLQQSPWQIGVDGGVMQTGYLESNVSRFNLTSVAPRVFADYSTPLFGVPSTIELAYAGHYDWFRGKPFFWSHGPQASVDLSLTPEIDLIGYYHLNYEQFNSDGPNPNATSRDAFDHRAGAAASYWFDHDQHAVALGYEFRRNDAQGANFILNAHRVYGRFWTQLVGPLSMALEAGYTHEDYNHFTTSPKRKQDDQYYRGVLYLAVAGHVTIDVYYSYHKLHGTRTTFDAQRNTAGAGLTYRF